MGDYLDLKPGDFQKTTVDGGLAKLVRIWEYLRELNTGGYGSGRLVSMTNAMKKTLSGRTDCSPFTATCIQMMLDPRPVDTSQPYALGEPYDPQYDGGKSLSHFFYYLHNSFPMSEYKNGRGWKADFKRDFVDRITDIVGNWDNVNHPGGSLISLNIGVPVEKTKMRRGDVVGIDWMNDGGHAVFCWNVHLNAQGDVDCFQYVSSNGSGSHGLGVSVCQYPMDPNYLEATDGKYKKKKDLFTGIIADPQGHPEFRSHPYQWYALHGVKKGDIDTSTFGVPKGSLVIVYDDFVWNGIKLGIKDVRVARLNGITPPEPYLRADGKTAADAPKDAPPPQPKPVATVSSKPVEEQPKKDAPPPPKAPPPADAADHQVDVELFLQQLWAARWIGVDPGSSDSVNDKQSQAAIANFQKLWMGGKAPSPGHADPKTRKLLAEIAAWAVGMPMVHAALQALAQAGKLTRQPGSNPLQLDDATRASVKEFQSKYGCDVDGIPGPQTQKKLAESLKDLGGAPAQPAAKPAASSSSSQPAASKPTIDSVYFTTGYGKAGSKTGVAVTAEGLDGKTLSVSLSQGGAAGDITIAQGKGSVEVTIPAGLADGTEVSATVSGEGLTAETKAKFTVGTLAVSSSLDEAAEMHFGVDWAVMDGNKPDYAAAKKDGPLSFVIIRANYGAGHADSNFHKDYQAAKDAGLVRGGYHFFVIGKSKYDPETQAKKGIEALGDIDKTDFPPGIDVEFDLAKTGQTAAECLEQVRACVKAFKQHYGVAPMIYTSVRVWVEAMKNLPAPDLNECPLWLAKPYIHDLHKPADRDLKNFANGKNAPAQYLDGMFKQHWPAAVPNGWGDKDNWWIHQYQGDAWQFPGFKQVDVNRFNSMRKGASGDRVKWVQRRLGVQQDGAYDGDTLEKVKKLQADNGIKSDGTIGPATFAVLCWMNP